MDNRKPQAYLEHLYQHDWYAQHQAWLDWRGILCHNPLGAEPKQLKLNRATLSGLDLRRANLQWAVMADCRLVNCNLSRANLGGSDLRGTFIENCHMPRASLLGAKLDGCDIEGLAARECRMLHTTLENAVVRFSDFSYAIARHIVLRNAELHDCSLLCTDLRDADLSGIKLTECAGNGFEVISMSIHGYEVCIFNDQMSIGCVQKPISEWLSVTDAEIKQLDDAALRWSDQFRTTVTELLRALGKLPAGFCVPTT